MEQNEGMDSRAQVNFPDADKAQRAPVAGFRWLTTGKIALGEMLESIEAARNSLALEMYIFTESPVAGKFRDALLRAQQRGVRVRVLLDAVGSFNLPSDYWETLTAAGGQVRWFNPLTLHRISLRDHRKLLVCDGAVAFVGGFNISSEYEGDGVTSGWRDLGLKISGPLVPELSAAFDEMFERADFKHPHFARLRISGARPSVSGPDARLLLAAPGRHNPIQKTLRADLKAAKKVFIVCAYFLPAWQIRRALMNVVRRGGEVQVILPGKSDVPLSQWAGRSLYRRLLRAGVRIFEYQPQILHAKLIMIDDVVYAGSANLDTRSLHINYELSIRVANTRLAGEAAEIFDDTRRLSQEIHLDEWRRSRTFWTRLKQRWSYIILARLDPFLSRQQLKWLR